ncbi:MAG TPA: hypothetical protein VMB50_10805 [Myxococcales bacterium]|nr:hypothetical protein [Myxococcales bacterium]
MSAAIDTLAVPAPARVPQAAAPPRRGSPGAALLAPADRWRRRAFRLLGPLARPYLASRESRVALLGAFTVAVAFAATALSPLWLLALSPLVFGVPHLLSDFRYLVVRRGLHRRPAVWLGIGVPLAAVSWHPTVAVGLTAVLGALVVARTDPWKRLLGLALWAAATSAALSHARLAGFAFAHAHNLVALALWWFWRPRRGRWHWLVLGLVGLATLAIFGGPATTWAGAAAAAGGPSHHPDLGAFASAIAPFADPALAWKCVLFFAFAQAVHYGVWLRLVPEDDRPRPAPRPFAASWRALRAELGPVLLLACGAVAVGLAVWGAFDLAAARDGYLRLAFFHGHLELAAAALLWAEGRRLDSAPA